MTSTAIPGSGSGGDPGRDPGSASEKDRAHDPERDRDDGQDHVPGSDPASDPDHDSASEPDTTGSTTSSSGAGSRVRIHLPVSVLITPVLVLFCVIPLATTGGAWAISYAIPAALFLLLVVAGTTANAEHLSSRWIRGRTSITWDELAQIEFPSGRWAAAVTQSGDRILLPGVRPADLPAIVRAAGGKLFLQRPREQPAQQQVPPQTSDFATEQREQPQAPDSATDEPATDEPATDELATE